MEKEKSVESIQKDIREALIKQNYYNPYDVFHHEPEFYQSPDERYLYKIHIVKWNTRSTRVIILWVKWNEKKQKYIFARKPGQTRTPHGEQMR